MSTVRGVKLEGRVGTWYVVDTGMRDGRAIVWLESEIYGDDAAWVGVYADTGEEVDE